MWPTSPGHGTAPPPGSPTDQRRGRNTGRRRIRQVRGSKTTCSSFQEASTSRFRHLLKGGAHDSPLQTAAACPQSAHEGVTAKANVSFFTFPEIYADSLRARWSRAADTGLRPRQPASSGLGDGTYPQVRGREVGVLGHSSASPRPASQRGRAVCRFGLRFGLRGVGVPAAPAFTGHHL